MSDSETELDRKLAMSDHETQLDLAVSRIAKALDVAECYGQIDGAHHKMWVIDQMVRALTGFGYDAFVQEANKGDDGPNTYEWDIGIAP